MISLTSIISSPNIILGPLNPLNLLLNDLDLINLMKSCTKLYKKEYPLIELKNYYKPFSNLPRIPKIPKIPNIIWDKTQKFNELNYEKIKNIKILSGYSIIIDNIKLFTKLNSINLYSNNIGPEGASKIAEALKVSGLNSINLGYNNIGPEGASKIAEALKVI